MKYLLSDGTSTNKIEYYIIDLFKIYLTVYPNDIPGTGDIGFDFILIDIKKDQLENEINTRLNLLVDKFKKKMANVKMEIDSIELIDETKVKLVLSVNKIKSDEIIVDINN